MVCNNGEFVYEFDVQAVIEGVVPDPNNPFYNGTLPCPFPPCDNPFATCTPFPPTYPEGLCCDQLNQTKPMAFGCNPSILTQMDEYGNHRDGYAKIEGFDSGDCVVEHENYSGMGWSCGWNTIISPAQEDGTEIFGAWWALCCSFLKLWSDGDDVDDPEAWHLGIGISVGNMYDGNAYYQIIDLGGKKVDCSSFSYEFGDLQPAYDPGTPYGMFGYCSLAAGSITVERI